MRRMDLSQLEREKTKQPEDDEKRIRKETALQEGYNKDTRSQKLVRNQT